MDIKDSEEDRKLSAFVGKDYVLIWNRNVYELNYEKISVFIADCKYYQFNEATMCQHLWERRETKFDNLTSIVIELISR